MAGLGTGVALVAGLTVGPGVLARQTDGAATKAQSSATHGTAASSATTAVKPRTPAERLHSALVSLPPLPFHATTIVIDPGHGGTDSGARISDAIVEKDVTLALALKLRTLLTARGFNVVLTREDDKATMPTPPFAALTLDDRAGMANHERAGACLELHATGAGTGVHLYTSELTPAAGEQAAGPWLTLQAAWVAESQALAGRLADALNRSRVPLVDGSASVRPLDSMTCPAVVVELAPQTTDAATIEDEAYQQTVAEAMANALILWKDKVQAPARLAPAEPAGASAAGATMFGTTTAGRTPGAGAP
jgi:N-acetylmuramoyl-L-alanine amidase